MSRKTSPHQRARARERNRNRPGHRHVKTAYAKLPETERLRRYASHQVQVRDE